MAHMLRVPRQIKQGQRPEENTVPFNVRLDLAPLIRLPIGSVDVCFLAKKSSVSVTLWDLSI